MYDSDGKIRIRKNEPFLHVINVPYFNPIDFAKISNQLINKEIILNSSNKHSESAYFITTATSIPSSILQRMLGTNGDWYNTVFIYNYFANELGYSTIANSEFVNRGIGIPKGNPKEIEKTIDYTSNEMSLTLKLENEKKNRESKALQKIENTKCKNIERGARQEDIENIEFEQLLKEMIPLNFTNSAEVSSYIIKNNLGYKYKNISGIVKMKREGDTWDFEGGFPSKIYARICSELGLENKGSSARVVGFDSFQDLNK